MSDGSKSKYSFASLIKSENSSGQSDSSGSGSFRERFKKANSAIPADDGSTSEENNDSSDGGAGNYSAAFTKREKVDVVNKTKEKHSLKGDSLAEGVRRGRKDCLFLVRGKDRGKAAWHYVLVHKRLKEQFLSASRSGSLDVSDYGEVLYSGWGKDPSAKTLAKIKKEFDID